MISITYTYASLARRTKYNQIYKYNHQQLKAPEAKWWLSQLRSQWTMCYLSVWKSTVQSVEEMAGWTLYLHGTTNVQQSIAVPSVARSLHRLIYLTSSLHDPVTPLYTIYSHSENTVSRAQTQATLIGVCPHDRVLGSWQSSQLASRGQTSTGPLKMHVIWTKNVRRMDGKCRNSKK